MNTTCVLLTGSRCHAGGIILGDQPAAVGLCVAAARGRWTSVQQHMPRGDRELGPNRDDMGSCRGPYPMTGQACGRGLEPRLTHHNNISVRY